MEEEINLLDYWRVLKKRRWVLLAIVSAITLVSIVYALLATKLYQAKVTLMPLGNQTSPLQQSALAGLLGGMGGGSTGAQLVAILNSRTLAERVIDRLGLQKEFFPKLWDENRQDWRDDDPKRRPTPEALVKKLSGGLQITEDKKNSTIAVSYNAQQPELTAKVANGAIEELARYLAESALTSAKRNRIFIEKQLEQNKVQLLEAGKELARFYEEKKISSSDPRTDVDVSVTDPTAFLGPQLSETSPELKKLLTEKERLDQTVRGALVVKDVPEQVYLQYLTQSHSLLGQINALLTQQYEMAKIEEAKEDISFSVIDWARVPEKMFKPKRRQIVMTAFAMSLFLAIFTAFFLEYIERMRGEGKNSLRNSST